MKVLKSVLNAVACIIGVCGCLQNETAAFPCCVIGLPGVVASDSGVKKVVSGQALAEDICSKIGLPCPVWTKKSEIPTTHDVDNSENEPNENSVWLSSPSSDYESSDCDEEVFDLNQSFSCAEKQNDSRKRIIVLYDCDDVLHKNTDATLQKTYIGDFLKKNRFSKEQMKTLIRGGRKDLVEHDVLNLFSYLKNQGIPQFVFTQCSSDEGTRAWRHGVLNELGYDFNSKLFEKDQFEISVECSLVPQLGQSEATPPIYDNGIIFAGSAPKGEVFKAFLNCIYNEIPDQFVSPQELTVIFVDDKYDNVLQVGNVCEKLRIGKYLGYNYTAVEKIDRAKSPLPDITDVQVKGLNKGMWLSDCDAGLIKLLKAWYPTERNYARAKRDVSVPIF